MSVPAVGTLTLLWSVCERKLLANLFGGPGVVLKGEVQFPAQRVRLEAIEAGCE